MKLTGTGIHFAADAALHSPSTTPSTVSRTLSVWASAYANRSCQREKGCACSGSHFRLWRRRRRRDANSRWCSD